MDRQDEIRMRLFVPRILWVSLIISGFIYGAVCYLQRDGMKPEALAQLMAENAASLKTLTPIFGVLAGAVAALSLFVLPLLMKALPPFVLFIVRMSLGEVICILGFILAQMGAPLQTVYSFMGGGIFCMVVLMPTRELGEALLKESEGSSQTNSEA